MRILYYKNIATKYIIYPTIMPRINSLTQIFIRIWFLFSNQINLRQIPLDICVHIILLNKHLSYYLFFVRTFFWVCVNRSSVTMGPAAQMSPDSSAFLLGVLFCTNGKVPSNLLPNPNVWINYDLHRPIVPITVNTSFVYGLCRERTNIYL